jgi:hypothetical protein
MTLGDHLVRWTTTASVVLLTAIAAIVSYRHTPWSSGTAKRHGSPQCCRSVSMA